MERLVIKDGKGNLYFCDTERGVKLESYEVQPLQRREVLERLYEYEGTGLAPEEIMKLAERDTPKIPIYQVPGDERYEQEPEWWECPSCGEIYDMDEDCDFCPNCGQSLMR